MAKTASTKAGATKTGRPTRSARSKAGGAAPDTTPQLSEAAKARRDRSARALTLYEKGITALQARQFAAAQQALRQILDEYTEERELVERARLYLAVCERETAADPAVPKTTADQIYAATVALNAGAVDDALRYLTAAVEREPDNAHVHYMLAVARTQADEVDTALTHLERAIALHPERRLPARREPDFERLHENERFQRLTAGTEPRRSG